MIAMAMLLKARGPEERDDEERSMGTRRSMRDDAAFLGSGTDRPQPKVHSRRQNEIMARRAARTSFAADWTFPVRSHREPNLTLTSGGRP
jgi:hypothetical protein